MLSGERNPGHPRSRCFLIGHPGEVTIYPDKVKIYADKVKIYPDNL